MKRFQVYTNSKNDDQACKWFSLMCSDLRTENDIVECDKWLNSDGRNYHAYQQVEALWSLFGSFSERAEILAMVQRVRYDSGF